MLDCSEGLMNIEKLENEAWNAVLHKDDKLAIEKIGAIEAECNRLRNWFWKNRPEAFK